MEYDDWNAALAPKVTGIWNLHRTLLNTDLDFFLIFGSLSGWRGNRGQANYAAANTFLDSFAQYRRRLGLPVSLVTLGPVGGIGQVSKDTRLLQVLHTRSVYLLTERDVLNAIKASLTRKNPEISDGCRITCDLGFGMVSTQPKREAEIAGYMAQDLRYGLYPNLQTNAPEKREAASDSVLQEIASEVKNDPSLLDKEEYRINIRREMGKQINMYTSNAENLSDEELANLHIDSLMSLEIRYYLQRHLNIEVSLMEVSNVGTVRELCEVIIKTLKAKYNKKEAVDDAQVESSSAA